MAESKKSAAPPGQIAVTFAREFTIGDKTYKPDETATLPPRISTRRSGSGSARPDVRRSGAATDSPADRTIVSAQKSKGE